MLGVISMVVIGIIVLIVFGLSKLLDIGWVFGYFLWEFKNVVEGII